MNPATKKRRCTFRRSPQPCDAKVLYIEADYTGVPMRREELVGHKGKAPDGKAKTRMAALGCVFPQHQLDDQSRPLRDYGSTTYLAGFESPSDFGIGLRREALRRGMGGVANHQACSGPKKVPMPSWLCDASTPETASKPSGPIVTQISPHDGTFLSCTLREGADQAKMDWMATPLPSSVA